MASYRIEVVGGAEMIDPGSSISVISRQATANLRHLGVLLPDGQVAHCTPQRGEHISTVEEFANGQDVKIERSVPAEKYWPTLQHLLSALCAPKAYHLVTNNCEIFANRVTGEKEESPQLQGAVMLVVLFAIVALVALN